MTLAPGTKLGPYEILAPIGAGGMRPGAGQVQDPDAIFLITNVEGYPRRIG